MTKRSVSFLLSLLVLLGLFSGCAAHTEGVVASEPDDKAVSPSEPASAPSATEIMAPPATESVKLENYAGDLAVVPVSQTPAQAVTLMPVASGKNVENNGKAEIDWSNTADGYVMIRYLQGGTARIKVIITGPNGSKYTYNLRADGAYECFPLSDGSGAYSIGVYRNVQDTKYAVELTKALTVQLRDEYAPYLLPNQYVNYTAQSAVVAKAAELTAGRTTDLEKIKAVYEYVVTNLTYDKQRAATVQSGYLPVLDDVLAKKQGICFDYAALMTAMLRSQGIPCKLVVGYAGTVYHAWISTHTAELGWITSAIYFDGVNWKLMDPTFASSSNSSPDIMKYIGDGSNYATKYLY